ncbi:MAG: sulfatase [Victivallales bacterium]|jgi:N-sulfoglucosamine sulfohydrolase|nr:sulfatase [Victivallales bacterium]
MSNDRPNIVLMVADDHGLDGGCFGTSAPDTSNLDALAGDGVQFTNAFCTTASCAASRSVILTGLQNHANGAFGHVHGRNHFSCYDDVVSLPVMLRDAGYRTGRAGKYHHAPVDVFPFGSVLAPAGRDDVGMSEKCRGFIEQDEPFFLYWCSHNPHRDGHTLDSHPCRPNRFGNPDKDFPGDTEQLYDENALSLPHYLPNTPEARAEWAQYCQSVSRLDRGVGRLMQILRDTGKYDNTLVIYISDNGAAFPVAKTTLYDPGMNLPCLVRSPGGANQGTTCDGLVTWADITPTILDCAGVGMEPDQFHGDSFLPIVDEESPSDWREEIYAAHTFHEITNYYPMRVVRTQTHKFIYNIAHGLPYSFASDLWRCATWQATLREQCETFGSRTVDAYIHRPRFELFDLVNDPNETVNLAELPEYAGMVADFSAKLKAFQQRTNDPWVHKWEYE